MTNYTEPFWIRLPQILTGKGAVAQAGDIAKNLGVKKALIVTDAGIVKAGLLENIKNSLEKAGVAFEVFDRSLPNAIATEIKNCADMAREGKFELLIGVGGGSVMDTTKLAAVAAKEAASIEDIDRYGINGTPRKGLPKILIPTTAGTGSEASASAVFTDHEGVLRGTRGENTVAEFAIVDPDMTQNLPPKLTAETGFDAFCHAFEAYTGNRANIVSEALDEMAIKLIAANLRPAYRDGAKNPDARYKMAIAATFAMASVSMSQAGLPHAMGHVIQDVVSTTHSNSLSVLLPAIMEFNVGACPEKFARVTEFMGEDVGEILPAGKSQKAVRAVKRLITDLQLPSRMRDLGIKKEQIPHMVDLLFTTMVRNVGNNPRPVSREDAAGIFEAAW